MVQEKPRSVLRHRDDRHSYIKRLQSPVGPGDYTIPSTFNFSNPNLLLREVQRETYGREFSRQNRNMTAKNLAESAPDQPHQLCLATVANMHRSRRDQLRRKVQADRWNSRNAASSPLTGRGCPTITDSTATSTRAESLSESVTPISPTISSRQHGVLADVTDLLVELKERVDMVEEQFKVQPQLCVVSAYHRFLMSTSYLERLQKQKHVTTQ